MSEFFLYYTVKILGVLMRALPVSAALGLGRAMGGCVYAWNAKLRKQAYTNLKTALISTHTPGNIKKLTKQLFRNFGMNLVELLRMPLLTEKKFREMITVEGEEHIQACLDKGKGAILLAMHFGSWEMASVSCAILGYPYRVIVNPQGRYKKLNELLNKHRSCGGSVVLSRGMGTRDLIRGLKNNEVIGMVVDQGGKTGMLAPFFGKTSSFSIGALRMAFKLDVPLCFSVIKREAGGAKHKIIVHEPWELKRTGDMEEDIRQNLKTIARWMEDYIRESPDAYMWFYKTWKYSDQADVVILDDGRTGHLRQSQAVCEYLKDALEERNVTARVKEIPVAFKSKWAYRLFCLQQILSGGFFIKKNIELLRHFLKEDSYRQMIGVKPDYVISCGSVSAGVNYYLSKDSAAKSVSVLGMGIFGPRHFDRVILPQHDRKKNFHANARTVFTKGALNLMTPEHLSRKREGLLNQYSHLKNNLKPKIAIFVGGDSKNIFISESQMRILFHQIKDVSEQLKMSVMITNSRRTPAKVDRLLEREIKSCSQCVLFIDAKKNNIPEAVGGMLSLADIIIVSGDSISMVSEAVSSQKPVIVFYPEVRGGQSRNKHWRFVSRLNAQNHVVACEAGRIGQTVLNVAKQKIKTRPWEDRTVVFESVRKLI